MTQAIVDPQDLRRFAAQLHQFNEELRGGLSGLQAGFTRVGETWRDQEHERFAELFAETTEVLAKFIRAGEHHVPYLIRKAEKIEEYLHLR